MPIIGHICADAKMSLSKQIPRILAKSEFVRSVATLMSGNVVALAITIGSAPVVTRLFSPDQFGLFAVFMAMVGVTSQVCCLCYERAILLPKEDDKAKAVLFLSILTLVGFGTGILCAGLLFRTQISMLLGDAGIDSWVLILPIGIAVVGGNEILRYWIVRQVRFRLLSISRVVEAATAATIKIVIGLSVGNWVGGLILGNIFGSLTAAVLLLYMSKIEVKQWSRIKIAFSQVINAAAEFRQFPLFASWNALLTTSSMYVPVFLLSAFFGPAVVGHYNLAGRMLSQPIATVSGSVSKVYFQKAATQNSSNDQILPGLLRTLGSLLFIGFFPFIIIGVFSVEIFSLVFGREWGNAGYYAQIMTPWFFLLFVRAPAVVIFEVCKKQQLKLAVTFSNLVVTVAVLIWLYREGYPPAIVIAGFVAVNVFMGLIQIALAIRVAKRADRQMNRSENR